jgi:hypothetical protein
MTELKTLKDISLHRSFNKKGSPDFCVDREELRQEAIKWVKNLLQNEDIKVKVLYNTRDGTIPCNSNNLAAAIIMAEFFNLTEEDLK